ncbi:MAG: ParB/RepB/Spo0J family partition protein [Candidatus Harrisonbacteria bacterium]|nr:ParB/RepB/Spo0J family partition protein [Candidatus Harrisonbacteria bacterium]
MENTPIQGPVFLIEVDKISPNPQQPRRDFNKEELSELAASIREFGLLQPIVVTKLEKESETGTEIAYQLVAGERRWRAAQMLGLERIPAIIRNVDLERERLELAVLENVQRANLNPIESARAYARLQDEFKLTQREIAARIGKSREVIANTMRLLGLPTEVQEAISRGEISESQGRLLLTVDDQIQQKMLFSDLLRSNLSVRELRNRIQALKISKTTQDIAPPTASVVDAETSALQKELESALGAKVRVEKSGETGKLIISFYSPEELRGIVERLARRDDNLPPSPPLAF